MPGFILAENLLESATVYSEATLSGFPAANCVDGVTATKTGVTGDGTNQEIIFDLGTAQSVDTVAIYGQNLESISSANITIAGSNTAGSGYFNMHNSWNILSNEADYKEFTGSYSYRYIRITINATGGSFYFSNIAVGTRLDLERSQKHGFIKPEFIDNDTLTANLTRGQNLTGITVNSGPKRARFDLFYYSESFFSTWPDIVAIMKQRPIYFLWDDNQKLFYCWPTKKMPQPAYAKNINNYYNVKLDMSGFIE